MSLPTYFEAERTASNPDYRIAGFLETNLVDAVSALSEVEHEYFHVRTTLSTTYGWLSFYLSQVLKTFKMEVCEHARGTWNLHAPLSTFFTGNESLRLFRLLEADAIARFLATPSLQNFKMLRSFRNVGKASPQYAASLVPPDALSFCGPIAGVQRPSVKDLECHQTLGSVFEIFEAAAVWKEFSYASALYASAVGQDSDLFYRLTDDFIRGRTRKVSHRRAADLIGEHLGLGLSSAGTGALLDIALCPPLNCEALQWSEFHPCARLFRLVHAAKAIQQPDWLKRPNYHPFSTGEYEELDETLAKHLGWRTARENSRNLLEWFKAERSLNPTVESGERTPLDALMRTFIEQWFGNCLGNKSDNCAIFISPSCAPPGVIHALGVYSQPASAVFDGFLRINDEVIENEALAATIISDTMHHIFLESFISSITKQHVSFELARHYYNAAKGWAAFNPNSKLKDALRGNFDELASELTGVDWKKYSVSVPKPSGLSPPLRR